MQEQHAPEASSQGKNREHEGVAAAHYGGVETSCPECH